MFDVEMSFPLITVVALIFSALLFVALWLFAEYRLQEYRKRRQRTEGSQGNSDRGVYPLGPNGLGWLHHVRPGLFQPLAQQCRELSEE